MAPAHGRRVVDRRDLDSRLIERLKSDTDEPAFTM